MNMRCTKCGRELPENARFCNKCGTPVSAEIISPEGDTKNVTSGGQNEEKEQRNGKHKILIFIPIFALAVAGGIVYGKIHERGDVNLPTATEKEIQAEEDIQLQESEDELTENTVDDSEVSISADSAVEAEVLAIREKYNEITTNISSGNYTEFTLRDGVTVYCDGAQLQAIILQAGTDNNSYRRSYYYSDDELIFAYYEAEDAYRFYFDDREMIRWRYSQDALNAQEAVNHDLEQNEEYQNRETDVLAESDKIQYEVSSVLQTSFSMSNVTYVSSTSSLSEYNMTHSPERVIDGDLSTAWVEGADGQGTGEAITLYFDKQYLIRGADISAGYQKSSSLYDKNSRPEKVRISFGNEFSEVYTLQDINGEQEIVFYEPVITDHITFTIESVYAGSRYEDTVISEISVY